jgi:hypothetical protein
MSASRGKNGHDADVTRYLLMTQRGHRSYGATVLPATDVREKYLARGLPALSRGAKGKPPIRRTKIGVFEVDDKTLRGHSPSLRSVYIQEVEHSFLKLFVRGLEQVEFVAFGCSHATGTHRYINFSVRPNRK